MSKKVSVVALSWLATWVWLYVAPNEGNRAGSAAAEDKDNTVTTELKTYIEDTTQIATPPKPQTASAQTAAQQAAAKQAAANKLKADYHKPESIALEAELNRVNREIAKLKQVPKTVPIPIVTVKAVKVALKPNAAHEQAELAAAQTKIVKAQQRYQLAQQRYQLTQQQLTTMPTPEMETEIATDNRVEPIADERVLAPIFAAQAIATKEPAAVKQSSRTKEIQTELANAQRELETAQAGLMAVMERHQQARLAWQIAELDRQERSFQAELNRVKQMESVNLQSHNRQYQIAQLQLKKIHLESQIKELAVAVTPFDGTVQQVRMVAKEGNMVRYEVGVLYAQATVQPRSEAIAIPRWQEDREEKP